MPATTAHSLRMHRLLRSLSLVVSFSFLPIASGLLAQLPSSPSTAYRHSDSAPPPLPSAIQARSAGSPPRPADCPAELEPKCSCVLLQSEKIGIFCDEAPSLEAVVDSLSTIQVPVHTLYITNTPIPTLKANAFPDPLTVHKLYIVNATLSAIEEGAFSGPLLNSLEELELSHCALTTIPIAGVGELRALRSLDLSSNRIDRVQPYTFLYYQARNLLENLDLTANSLQQFAPESLLGLESLKRLALDKNHFRSIPTQTLRALSTSLEELTLSVNQIEFVGPEDLPPMPRLRSLALEVNRIGYIEPEFFQQAPQLLYLYLSHNAFTAIDPEMFEPIGALRVLALNKNMISRLGAETFQFTPSLVRIELADNFIAEIGEGTFQGVGRTQYISLARNRLRRIPKQMFSSLPLLVTLDLNGNMIAEVEDFAFSSLPSLQMLDLARNQIAHLSSNTLYKTFERAAPSTPHIARVLNLHDNPLACDEDLLWLVKWLAERPNMRITAPGNAPTSCTSPASLRGVPLRNVNITAIEPKSVGELQIMQRKWPVQRPNITSTIVSTPPTARQTSTRWPDLRLSGTGTTATTTTPVNSVPMGDNKGRHQAKIADTGIAVMLIIVTLVLIGLTVVLLVFVKTLIPSARRRARNKTSRHKSLPSNLSRSMSPSPPLPFLLRHSQQQSGNASRTPPRDYHSPASQLSRPHRAGGEGIDQMSAPPPAPGVGALRASIMSAASLSQRPHSYRPNIIGSSGGGPTFKVYYGDSTDEWRRPKAVESHWRF